MADEEIKGLLKEEFHGKCAALSTRIHSKFPTVIIEEWDLTPPDFWLTCVFGAMQDSQSDEAMGFDWTVVERSDGFLEASWYITGNDGRYVRRVPWVRFERGPGLAEALLAQLSGAFAALDEELPSLETGLR